jgi:hypothetical protein
MGNGLGSSHYPLAEGLKGCTNRIWHYAPFTEFQVSEAITHS